MQRFYVPAKVGWWFPTTKAGVPVNTERFLGSR
jgi:hypothetical protein